MHAVLVADHEYLMICWRWLKDWVEKNPKAHAQDAEFWKEVAGDLYDRFCKVTTQADTLESFYNSFLWILGAHAGISYNDVVKFI